MLFSIAGAIYYHKYTGNYSGDKAPLVFWKWNEIMMNKKLVNEANKRGEGELARIGK